MRGVANTINFLPGRRLAAVRICNNDFDVKRCAEVFQSSYTQFDESTQLIIIIQCMRSDSNERNANIITLALQRFWLNFVFRLKLCSQKNFDAIYYILRRLT